MSLSQKQAQEPPDDIRYNKQSNKSATDDRSPQQIEAVVIGLLYGSVTNHMKAITCRVGCPCPI